MARPKSSIPPKGKINLTVTEQTRAELIYISQRTGRSISNLVADWAAKDAKKIAKKRNEQMPSYEQLSIDSMSKQESC